MSSLKSSSIEPTKGLSEVNIEISSTDDYSSEGLQKTDVHRGLESRHVQLIALGGAIGTGLFVGSGAALAAAGPASILIAYILIAIFVWTLMNQLGEMVTYIPAPGKATVYALCERYTGSKSLSFAAGLNLYYAQALLAPAEITAAAFVIQYWSDLNVAIWISIFWVSMVALNFLAVKFFGEVEFWIASIKVLCILGLIIVGIVIFFGGGPAQHHVLGFHYWKHPGAFVEHLTGGAAGRFCGILTAIIKSAFAFILAPEFVACCAAESVNPRVNLPKATDRFIYRLIFFYICGVLVIGVIVASNDPRLMNAIASGSSGAAASPFVIGIQNAGIKVLNHIVNACILTSAYSCGNSFIYAGSRTLHSMAIAGQVPKLFGYTNKYGIPYYSVALTAAIALISYLNVSSSSSQVFTWLSNISTVSGFISWILVSVTYLRYRKAIDYHGMTDRVPYRPPLQVIGSWGSIIFFSLISLVNGYAVFFSWSTADFFAAYITLPIFFALLFGHMAWSREICFWKPSSEIDVITGLEEIEKEEAEYDIPVARNWLEKVWFWIC
ncbi:hypothetical protein B5S28_g2960 [[Candida] boidinii]|nr:hypothetical protein B5S28_g2960 [[Candida] boidinii]OWB60773.1 hypothetical protein B5S29_g1654 [[Candida] boidinii]OWB73950.1 hypothetical protein B5S31_g3718 [[Candida] boidinii]OWB79833.1 hypothetical protein B5S32_g4072 [[Candida] boidinii]